MKSNYLTYLIDEVSDIVDDCNIKVNDIGFRINRIERELKNILTILERMSLNERKTETNVEQ